MSCPGRDYCNPTVPNCGIQQNFNHTWFYTGQAEDTDGTCGNLSTDTAINKCTSNASTYSGGSYVYACITNEPPDLQTYICVRPGYNGGYINDAGWDVGLQEPCCFGIVDDVGYCAPDWCPGNVLGCRNVLIDYCGNYPENAGLQPVCFNFCKDPANLGICDIAMNTYCNDNSEKQICNCIKSNIPEPTCFDPICTSGIPFVTKIQFDQAQNCPAFCGNIIECLNAKTCNITQDTFNNYCSNDPYPTPTPTPTPNYNNTIVLLFFCLVLIFLGIVMVGIYQNLFQKKK